MHTLRVHFDFSIRIWNAPANKNSCLVILIILTILIPYHFGVEDILWFLGHWHFSADNVVWTWYWLNQYLPPCTTGKHLVHSAIGIASLVACWTLFLAKKWMRFTFSYLREQRPPKWESIRRAGFFKKLMHLRAQAKNGLRS